MNKLIIGIKTLCAFVVLLCFFSTLVAQNKYQFNHLTAEDGLLDNMTFAIFQDSKGYIWIGSKAGLQRYDGYDFVNFTYNFKHPASGLQEMVIRHITESSDGTIWVGTAGGGITRYKDGKLLAPMMHEPGNENSLSGSMIDDIIEDKKTWRYMDRR